jgi:hypothetical protein
LGGLASDYYVSKIINPPAPFSKGENTIYIWLHMITKFKHILITCGITFILATSCVTINVSKIKHDEGRDVYTIKKFGKHIVLRNNNGNVVCSDSFKTFLLQLANNQFIYNYNNSFENDNYISNSDFKLAQAYSQINQLITKGEYYQAIQVIDSLQDNYNSIIKFSDVLFLKGFSYEKLNQADSAKQYYSEFINKSEQKYSARFREYSFADTGHASYIAEKIHARDYFIGIQAHSDNNNFIKPIIPKYYYLGNTDGFTTNSDEWGLKKRKYSFLIGTDYNNHLAVGAGIFQKVNKQLSVFPFIAVSNSIYEGSVALPIQLYKQKNNFWGIKASPFISYNYFNYVYTNNVKQNIYKGFYNGGCKISIAYFINQNISLGSNYKYSIYNSQNPYNIGNDIEIGVKNQYDISMYYKWSKTMGIKAGVRNSNPEIGLLIGTSLFTYNITNNEFMFVLNVY